MSPPPRRSTTWTIDTLPDLTPERRALLARLQAQVRAGTYRAEPAAIAWAMAHQSRVDLDTRPQRTDEATERHRAYMRAWMRSRRARLKAEREAVELGA